MVSRPKDEGRPNSCPSIASGIGFNTGFMAPETDVSLDAPSAAEALRNSRFATEISVEAEFGHLLKELNRFQLENKQLKKLVLEKDSTMKAISTCLVDIEKNVATVKTEE